jgi:Fur family zinc uptake transcriptional regulator
MTATTAEDQRARERVKLSIDRATAIFAEKNIRFTDLRRKVFEEIASTHASVGAYEVLDRLAKKGTRLAPISIYRALDALLEAGVVHRLESKNAYFACRQLHKPRTGKRPMFLSCEKCGAVQEVDGDEIFTAIDAAAHGAKFEPRVRFAEVSGTCHECAARRQS